MAAAARDPSVAALAYELSRSALDHQDGLLDELRARTGTLLAASSLVASFLGATAIARAGFGAVGTAALLAFVATVIASVYVLLPKRSLVFSFSGPVLLDLAEQEGMDIDDAYRHVTFWIDGFCFENELTVDRLFAWYRIAVLALLAEVCLWAVHLGGTL